MSSRKIEIFSAGCLLCDEVISQVQEVACPSCEVTIYDLGKGEGLDQAKELGVTAVPVVVVNGMVAPCCDRGPIDMEQLRELGLGQPLD